MEIECDDLTLLSNNQLNNNLIEKINQKIFNQLKIEELSRRNDVINEALDNLNSEYEDNVYEIEKIEDKCEDILDCIVCLEEEIKNRIDNNVVIYTSGELTELGQKELFNE